VDVSLFESALAWMTVHVANYTASGELPARLGSGAVITAPYQAFRTRDGFIMVAAANAATFAKLSGALGHPEWAQDARFGTNEDRLAHKQDLEQLIESQLAGGATTEWVERLEQAGVPCAPLQDVGQVVSAPQTQALGILQGASGEALRTVGLPISFDGMRPGVRLAPAKHGEHTDQILGELKVDSR
jgi:crotonobetainyl-CoA:carnitine CoA-transferase CaiB-like acyl-CoA transferase